MKVSGSHIFEGLVERDGSVLLSNLQIAMARKLLGLARAGCDNRTGPIRSTIPQCGSAAKAQVGDPAAQWPLAVGRGFLRVSWPMSLVLYWL